MSPDPVAGIRSAHGIRRILRFVILSGVERSRRIFAPNVCIAVTKVRRFFDSLTLAQNDSFGGTVHQSGKLEFGGESPLTMRARYSGFRYCPNPLGIVTANQLDKLKFG